MPYVFSGRKELSVISYYLGSISETKKETLVFTILKQPN